MAANEPSKCNSFVFLDLETTGIPHQEADGGRTKITEVSMISLARETLSTVHHDLPRIQPKLTFNVNPCKMISAEVTHITGLDNFMLEKENPFDAKAAALIGSFLNNCRTPICLVAHNGNCFDFPILKEELLKFPNIIPEDTRCGDTYLAFRDLFNRPDVDGERLTFNPFLNHLDIKLVKAAEAVEKDAKVSKTDVQLDDTDMKLVQMLNETTPQSQKLSPMPSSFLQSEINYRKRKLFPDADNGPTNVRGFSLANVYYRIFGRRPDYSHRAENDTIALIECSLKFGQPILDWFDKNSTAYSGVKPQYTPI